MAKREEEKKKRAEDPEEEGGLDTSSDREEDEETAREGAEESDESEESEEDSSSEDDADDEEEEEEDKAAASSDDEEEEARKSEPSAEESEESESEEDEPKAAADEAAEDDEEDGAPPAQLGTQRYVMSALFGGALLFAYLLGRAIDGVWLNLATRDWLVERVPVVAAVPDDDKALYATVAGGVVALVVAIRTWRKPDVKQWSEDVSSELLKVKWPTRKEVYASTVVVLTTSAVAVVYLFLLDRFWGFVTNQIYGTGL